MNEFWIIGDILPDEEPEDKTVILDDNGVIEVSASYVQKHPDWYQYVSTYTVNGVKYHSYRIL